MCNEYYIIISISKFTDGTVRNPFLLSFSLSFALNERNYIYLVTSLGKSLITYNEIKTEKK